MYVKVKKSDTGHILVRTRELYYVCMYNLMSYHKSNLHYGIKLWSPSRGRSGSRALRGPRRGEDAEVEFLQAQQTLRDIYSSLPPSFPYLPLCVSCVSVTKRQIVHLRPVGQLERGILLFQKDLDKFNKIINY